MSISSEATTSASAWTLKKAVTTLAIAPQTESLTRTGRMAYNLMIFKAQRMVPDSDGGYSAPLSEIIKGFGSTTRDSTRVRGYIEQMCTTLVRWFPLSRTDEAQAVLAGMETVPEIDPAADGRVFTLLSEARWTRRSGEQWVTWFYPPTIRDMVIEPTRWAQLDIKEMSQLSHYASVALYEICARYKDVPGGLTNRADPAFWTQALKPDPETKPREWRKVKNETVQPALAEINKLTSLGVELIEERKGRAVVSVQFKVRRKEIEHPISSVDITLVEQAAGLEIRERDLDLMVDEYGDAKVKAAMDAMEGRRRAQPTVPIKHPSAYLRKALSNGAVDGLFSQPDQVPAQTSPEPVSVMTAGQAAREIQASWLARRREALNNAMDVLSAEDLEKYADLTRASLVSKGLLSAAMQKRFESRQYRSPMVWEYIKNTVAEEMYGRDWRNVPVVSEAT